MYWVWFHRHSVCVCGFRSPATASFRALHDLSASYRTQRFNKTQSLLHLQLTHVESYSCRRYGHSMYLSLQPPRCHRYFSISNLRAANRCNNISYCLGLFFGVTVIMRFNFCLSLLAGLRLVVPASALSSIQAQSSPFGYSSQLKPINIRDFEQATGIIRRGSEDLSTLNLQTQSQLIYGRSGGLFQYL